VAAPVIIRPAARAAASRTRRERSFIIPPSDINVLEDVIVVVVNIVPLTDISIVQTCIRRSARRLAERGDLLRLSDHYDRRSQRRNL
jgi:hypothetical protein